MSKAKKTKITNSEKFMTMIFSIIIAIAIWLVAVYVDDPSITVTANNIEIRLLNEDDVLAKGLVIKNKEKFPSFGVKVSGKRSSLMNYMNKITVDFNVENINKAGEHTLEGTVSLPNASLTLAKKTNISMTVEVASLSEKKVKLYASQVGNNKEYIVRSLPEEPEILISGAADEVKRIAYAAVEVDISNAESDFSSYGEVYFCDSSGKHLDDVTSVNAQNQNIRIENKIYQKVLVPVKAKLSEELAESYVLDKNETVISPLEIEVGVLPGTKIESVTVEIDKNSQAEEQYRAFADAENAYIPYSNAAVDVKAVLNKITEKSFELELEAKNLPEGTRAEFEKKIKMKLRSDGVIDAHELDATLDLEGLSPGKNSVRVKVSGTGVISYEEKYVDVKLIKEE